MWLRPYVLGACVGVVAFEAVQLSVAAVHYVGWGHASLPLIAARRPVTLEPLSSKSAEILDGDPRFRSLVYGSSMDGNHLSGIWECDGPSTFRWHFESDETVYILEGGVEVEYGGTKHVLRPGDSAFFPAGIAAVWHVPERVRKSYMLSDPGRIKRWLRRLTPEGLTTVEAEKTALNDQR